MLKIKGLALSARSERTCGERSRTSRTERSESKGFTLVELMVVVSIIAILSVIGITIYTTTQKSARDAKRRGDINAVAAALEANRTNSGYLALNANQFSGGSIPQTDPQGNPYCANNTASATPSADPTAAWTVCPTATGWGAVGTNPPPGTLWKLCTWLEATTPNLFCRSSAQ